MNQETTLFPEKCIRGIISSNLIQITNNRKFVFLDAFPFELNPDRIGEFEECSINWEDDGSVEEFTLNQRKENGEYLFKGGIVKIKRKNLERQLDSFFEDIFTYERNELPENKFHGNFLINKNTNTKVKRMIRNSIAAIACKEIIERVYV